MNAKSRLAVLAVVAALLLSSCWNDAPEARAPVPTSAIPGGGTPSPVPADEKEFVPHTYSWNAIVMPESSGGVTVSAELKPIDDAALNGCSAISNQGDRYACEDEVRIWRANENADPSSCEFVHDEKAKAQCVVGASVREAQKEHDPKACEALTGTGMKESCRISAIMGDPMKTPTVAECETIPVPGIKTACMARASAGPNLPSIVK